MSTSVIVKQQVVITPSKPTPNHVLQLSAFDSQLFLRATVEVLFVYKPINGVEKATITNNVKSALGRTLVPFYPLAGRVRTRADGSSLEIDCRAQGVLFIDAISTNTISDFDGIPKRVDTWGEFLSLHVADVLEGAPLVIVQLTWLSDGGAVLAAGINHCVCDGIGFGHFVRSFALLAQGKRVEEVNPKPVWSRHLLGSIVSKSSLDDTLSRHPEFKVVSDISGLTSRYDKEQLIPTSCEFDKNRLNELRKLAEFKPTLFDVLAAHAWRSWARALILPSNQIVKLLFAINIRHRVNPSLPSGYYGNAIVFGCAEINVGELTNKGLGYAIELVMRAKERVMSDNYVKEIVELVSWNRYHLDSVCTLIMTTLSGLGLEADFGIGMPVYLNSVRYDTHCRLILRATSIKVNLAVLSSAVNHYLYFMKEIHAKM